MALGSVPVSTYLDCPLAHREREVGFLLPQAEPDCLLVPVEIQEEIPLVVELDSLRLPVEIPVLVRILKYLLYQDIFCQSRFHQKSPSFQVQELDSQPCLWW